jgi:AcrR family transcriptional regulator
MGLREVKRQRTYDAVSAAAIAMFLERGFDRVSVADVAAAAEISKPTLFRYFRSKEDLVLHRIADHQGEPARVVRERKPGQSPLRALRDHLLDGLARRDPVTGLNDHPEILAYHRMVSSTPALSARLAEFATRAEEALAEALAENGSDLLTARLAAGQILTVRRILARDNGERLAGGESIHAVHEKADAAARRAFDLLANGLYLFA